MSEVIAIASQKGGSGKTTTALNLSLAFAESGRRVLLLDVDPQGAVGHALKQEELALPGLSEVLTGQLPLREVLLPTKGTGLTLLPRGRLDPADACDFEFALREGGRLRSLLAELRTEYELILIDTPSGLGNATRAALDAADFALIPLQAEPLALRSIGQILRVLSRTREKDNPGIVLLGILPTMVARKEESSLNTLIESWRELAGVLETSIPREPVFGRASEGGVPLAYLAGRLPPEARRFQQLAEELLERIATVRGADTTTQERPARVLL